MVVDFGWIVGSLCSGYKNTVVTSCLKQIRIVVASQLAELQSVLHSEAHARFSQEMLDTTDLRLGQAAYPATRSPTRSPTRYPGDLHTVLLDIIYFKRSLV